MAIRRDVFLPRTATLHTNELNFYVRDEWRINSKLTLNLGLHYEVNTPFTEVKDKWVNFDPVTGKATDRRTERGEPHRQHQYGLQRLGARASASPISSTRKPWFAAATACSISRREMPEPISASSGSPLRLRGESAFLGQRHSRDHHSRASRS